MTQPPDSSLDGVLVLDKPAGISSAAALNRVKRLLPRPRPGAARTKIGHAGTLDPFATGVLLVLIGRATRRCEELMGQPKTYEAAIRLGATTETDDPESPPRLTPGALPVERAAVETALMQFRGRIEQRPPLYSALKVAGRRACDRVRDGEAVRLEPRLVHVYRIDLVNYAWPNLDLVIECGRGTYIRSIARDLGEALGVGGYLTALRRTRIGPYGIEQALTLEHLEQDGLPAHVLT